MSFTWGPAIQLANEKGKHTWTPEIISSSSSSSCPRPAHTSRKKKNSLTRPCGVFPDPGLKTEGASERWSQRSEWDYRGRGRGRRTGGPSLLFNGRVNKSLVKLSGLQPRVFTALVSITNKSRIALYQHRSSSPAPPAAPFSLELRWLYWEQQIKETSIWVWSPIMKGSCQHALGPVGKAGLFERPVWRGEEQGNQKIPPFFTRNFNIFHFEDMKCNL